MADDKKIRNPAEALRDAVYGATQNLRDSAMKNWQSENYAEKGLGLLQAGAASLGEEFADRVAGGLENPHISFGKGVAGLFEVNASGALKEANPTNEHKADIGSGEGPPSLRI